VSEGAHAIINAPLPVDVAERMVVVHKATHPDKTLSALATAVREGQLTTTTGHEPGVGPSVIAQETHKVLTLLHTEFARAGKLANVLSRFEVAANFGRHHPTHPD